MMKQKLLKQITKNIIWKKYSVEQRYVYVVLHNIDNSNILIIKMNENLTFRITILC